MLLAHFRSNLTKNTIYGIAKSISFNSNKTFKFK